MAEKDSPIVIEVPGPRIRLHENDEIQERILDQLSKGHCRLVLNFRKVEYVDSSFLGALIIALKRATSSGGDIRLCCLKESLLNIFQLMRLDRLFELFQTEEAAIESFK